MSGAKDESTRLVVCRGGSSIRKTGFVNGETPGEYTLMGRLKCFIGFLADHVITLIIE